MRTIHLVSAALVIANSPDQLRAQGLGEFAPAKPTAEQLEHIKADVAKQISELEGIELRDLLIRTPIGINSAKEFPFFADVDRGIEIPAGKKNVVSMAGAPEEMRAFERLIGRRNFLPAEFLAVGSDRTRAVCRIYLRQAFGDFFAGSGWGTGFLVAPDLIMTNNHVIPNKEFARSFVGAQFNFQRPLDGELVVTDEYIFDPDSFFHTDAALDFTLVRVKPKDVDGANQRPGQLWGALSLPASEFPLVLRSHVNIIQHPDGRHKEVVVHDNLLEKVFDNIALYTADTEPGSSGSPVFDNSWRIVALHHAGGEKDPTTGKFINNEGINIFRIVEHLRANLTPSVLVEIGL